MKGPVGQRMKGMARPTSPRFLLFADRQARHRTGPALLCRLVLLSCSSSVGVSLLPLPVWLVFPSFLPQTESAFRGSVACGILKHFPQEYSAKINVRYNDSKHPFSLERLNFTLWTLQVLLLCLTVQVVLLCLIVLAVSLWVDTSGCTAVSNSSGCTAVSDISGCIAVSDSPGCTAVSDSSGGTVASVTQRCLRIYADHRAF